MKNILKLLLLFSLFAINIFANDDMKNNCIQTHEKCCFSCAYPAEPKCPVYNFPYDIRPSCGTGLFFNVSYLYWQAKELNIDLGFAPIPTIGSNLVTSIEYKTIKMKFDFDSGIKVGIGYFFNYDNWALSLDYLRYTNKTSNEKNVGTTTGAQITTIWIVNSIGTGSSGITSNNFIKSTWSLKYDILDLMLSRTYFVGKKFLLKPAFGLNGGWIDQKYFVIGQKYRTAPSFATINCTSNNTSDTWLIGPKAFLRLDWITCKNFKFFGNIAASIFYQHFRLDSFQDFPIQTNLTTNFTRHGTNKFNYFNPSFETSIGISYNSCIFSNKFKFDVDLSYDFKYLWNQNLLAYTAAPSFSFFTPLDSYQLTLQGINISLGLDF